jgi:hypothetical protein
MLFPALEKFQNLQMPAETLETKNGAERRGPVFLIKIELMEKTGELGTN